MEDTMYRIPDALADADFFGGTILEMPHPRIATRGMPHGRATRGMPHERAATRGMPHERAASRGMPHPLIPA
jgi:hypothetical protein